MVCCGIFWSGQLKAFKVGYIKDTSRFILTIGDEVSCVTSKECISMVNRTVDIQFLSGRALTNDLM